MGQGTRIAYLVNLYPAVSHSFIRREIRALEALGIAVERVSVRAQDPGSLRDPEDLDEHVKTHAILSIGSLGLARVLLTTILAAPRRFLLALATASSLGWRSQRGWLRHLAYLVEACALKRHLAERQVAHVHAHFATNATTVALLCRELGGPSFSFTAHGTSCFDPALLARLDRKIERARFAVAVSHYGRAQLMRWSNPSCWNRIELVRCGLDESFLREPPSPVPSAARLLCVARLSPEKGHLVLLAAAHELLRDGVKVELICIGEGPLWGFLERRIQELDLGGVVRLLGSGSNALVREELARSRALVLASLSEGLPVVITEAFALGRPVVATAVGAVPELVETGRTGWLVPPGSSSELARALREVLTSPPSALDDLGRRGRSLVLERHRAEDEARRLAELFEAPA